MAESGRQSSESRAPLATLALLALASSCQCWGQSAAPPTTSAALVQAPIARIAISPPEAHIAVGDHVELRVDAWDADDNYIWLEDRPEVTVAWSAAAESLTGNTLVSGYDLTATGNPAVFTITGTSFGHASVTAAVTPPGSGILNTTADVHALVAGAALNEDRVITEPVASLTTPPGDVIAMLAGCRRNGSTVDDLPWAAFEFVGETALTQNLTETGCTRAAETVVLSHDYRMQLLDAGTLSGPPQVTLWTDGVGDVLHADTLAWDAKDQIDVYLYYFAQTADPDPRQTGLSRINKANSLFTLNRMGMTLVAIQATPSTVEESGLCNGLFIKNTLGIDVTPPRLIVIFVKNINGSSGPAGQTCYAPDTAPSRVIFINDKLGTEETLAHEIGHALSHEYPNMCKDHVVAGAMPGFSATNLMHERTPGIVRERLTAGQVFRMNVNTASWYQHEPGIANPHPGRACQKEPYASSPCAPLQVDPLTWTLTGPVNLCTPTTKP